MALNLTELAGGVLTQGVVSKLSEYLGEKPANTQAAVDAAVPSLIGAATQLASSPSGAAKLMELISPSQLNPDLLSSFSGLLSNSGSVDGLLKTGSGLVEGLLGNKSGAIGRMISSASGIQGPAASSLLSLLTPIVLGLLGREVARSKASPEGLSSLLASQADAVRKHAPSGLAAALGLGSLGELFISKETYEPPKVTTSRPVINTYEEPKRRGPKWWLWAIPLAALFFAILYLRSCSAPKTELTSIALPCGTTIQALQGGFTYTLANFMLRGLDSEMPKRIVFDNLNFETASTQLTPESSTTITDLTVILKCYPKMQVRIEGHTDNTGDAASNLKLSLDRAERVKALLVQNGVDGSRVTTEGLGQGRPVASNDTPEGRAKNRRDELVVTAR